MFYCVFYSFWNETEFVLHFTFICGIKILKIFKIYVLFAISSEQLVLNPLHGLKYILLEHSEECKMQK